MRNVWKIIKDDFRLLMSNAISIVVVLGLIVVPGMYVWFNLAGAWDPYNSVDNLEVAIVNEDAGYKSEFLPMDLHLGNSIVSALHENQGLKWAFTDYDNAMEKLNDSSYYAVIVIPQDFSNQLLSILDGSVESATLIYYSNEKSNPIAPKITGKGASAIQQNINSTFSNTIYSILLKTASNLFNTGMVTEASNAGISLESALKGAQNSINGLINELHLVKSQLNVLNDTINRIKSEMFSSDSADVADFVNKISEIYAQVSSAKSTAQSIKDLLWEHGISSNLVNSVFDLVCQLETSINAINAIVNQSVDACDSSISTLDSLSSLINNTNVQIDSLSSTMSTILSDIQSADSKLNAMLNPDDVNQVKNLLGNDTTKLATLITAPVQLDRIPVFHMPTNAASMSGFYISICIWVGSLILAALLEASLNKKRTKEFKGKNLKNWQVYLGRYAVFGSISLFQSTFIVLGCLFFLQIPAVHPMLFIVVIWFISICYSLFIYTMLASFGSIGKALCVVLLVLQIAATGGTFPIQLVIEPFQVISPYLPTTYSLKAINMCVAGFADNDLLVCVSSLVLTIIPLSLIMGLILRNPILKLNENFKEKVSKAKLLGI